MFSAGADVGNVIKSIAIETSHHWRRQGRGLDVGIIFLSLDLQLYRNANNVITEALLSSRA